MRWRDVSVEHNGKKAEVSTKSTPRNPLRGEGPFVGTIVCPNPDAVPILRSSGTEAHSFAWYWDVELID